MSTLKGQETSLLRMMDISFGSLPRKTNSTSKSKEQRKDGRPKEEMPKAQTEGETKGTVEEMSPAVSDRTSLSEMTKDELWEECLKVQEQLSEVRKQKKDFQTQRDKAQRSWDHSRRNLEETKANLRERLRVKQEAEKQHKAVTEKCKEDLKHLETAQHNEICDLKMVTAATTSKIHMEHGQSEVELRRKIPELKAAKREKDNCTQNYIQKLKQKHQHELWELNESYRQQAQEIEVQHLNKMTAMIKEKENRTKAELQQIDAKMPEYVPKPKEDISEDHVEYICKKWRKAKQEKLELQEQCELQKEKDEGLSRRMEAAQLRRRHLVEFAKEMDVKVHKSRQKMVTERAALAKSLKREKKKKLRVLEERQELEVKHMQLKLKYEQVQQEYDKLQKRHTEAIQAVQLKGDLKEMILERKIQAMTETLEKEQLKLWVALTYTQGNQTATKNIEDLFRSKDNIIKALKDEVSQDLKEYNDLKEKAVALGVHAKWLPLGDIKKSITNASEDSACKSLEDLCPALKGLCISENKDTPGTEPCLSRVQTPNSRGSE